MPLDLQPTLHGHTLVVKPLTEAHREVLFAVASDPLIWEQHPANRHERQEFDDFFDQALASGGAVVVETHDGRVIGASRYQASGEHPSAVEIGWTFLARSHWGGATNSELKTLMIDHALTGVDEVHFHVAPENRRSQRAVQKLGAHQVDTTRSDGYLAYVLDRPTWQARQRQDGSADITPPEPTSR